MGPLKINARIDVFFSTLEPPLLDVPDAYGDKSHPAKLQRIEVSHAYDFDLNQWHTRVTALLRRHTLRGKPSQVNRHERRTLDVENLPAWVSSSEARFITDNPAPATTLQLVEVWA